MRLRRCLRRSESVLWTLLPAHAASAGSSVMQRYMDQDYKAKPSIRRLGRRLESMFWTLLLACAASAAARSCRGTWTKITRRSQVSEGFSEGFKACLGRCFWDAQLQLKLGHTEVHGPSLQGEATSPKASPKAPKHVLDVASGTRSFS